MTRVLILDGYNVIGALDRYKRLSSLDEAREQLISDTLKAAGWTGHEILVVFDASRGPDPGRVQPLAGGAVRVIYSAPKETADDVIERLLRNKTSGPVTVCTGDFALQRAALAAGAARSVPREFAALLDELPALTRTPDAPFRARVADRLSPEVLHSLEALRRKAEGR